MVTAQHLMLHMPWVGAAAVVVGQQAWRVRPRHCLPLVGEGEGVGAKVGPCRLLLLLPLLGRICRLLQQAQVPHKNPLQEMEGAGPGQVANAWTLPLRVHGLRSRLLQQPLPKLQLGGHLLLKVRLLLGRKSCQHHTGHR